MADHGVFDLAVIGAGPAGSVAAYAAVQRGLRVALVDRCRFPRDKACGDGIGPIAVRVLRQYGLGEIFDGHDPVQSATVFGPSGARAEGPVPDVAQIKGNGYVIPRFDFDHHLFRQAVATGAYDFSGMRYIGMQEAADTRRVQLKDESGTLSDLSAHLVIGADGAYSAVRKHLVEPNPRKLRYMGIAMRAYAHTPDFQPGGKIGPHILFEFSKDLLPGYGWVFPLGNGRVNLGVGILLTEMQRRETDLKTLLTRFIDRLQARGVTIDSVEGRRAHQLPTIAAMPPHLTFNRAALIGDAAAMINPVSGEGIAYGVAAAARLVQALPANLADAKILNPALARFERDFRADHRLHFLSCRLTMAIMLHKSMIPAIIGATQKDHRILDDAVNMLVGDDRLHSPTMFRLLKAALR